MLKLFIVKKKLFNLMAQKSPEKVDISCQIFFTLHITCN